MKQATVSWQMPEGLRARLTFTGLRFSHLLGDAPKAYVLVYSTFDGPGHNGGRAVLLTIYKKRLYTPLL
jgi:hypothetical protein